MKPETKKAIKAAAFELLGAENILEKAAQNDPEMAATLEMIKDYIFDQRGELEDLIEE